METKHGFKRFAHKIMIENIIKSTLVFFALSVFSASCANAQTVSNQDRTKIDSPSSADLSNDEAVLADLQKIGDAKRAEIKTTGDDKLDAKIKNASKLESKDVCIQRLKESAKVIVIGFFRTDVGCHFDGAFIDLRFHSRDEADLSQIALAALGWEKATREKRENLAKIWVGEGLLAFYTVLYTEDVDFLKDFQSKSKVTYKGGKPPKQPELHPPQVVSNDS